MDNIIAETILYFYRDNNDNCINIAKRLEIENPINYGNMLMHVGINLKSF